MTLTMTIINEHGAWQSSDMRLTKDGKLVDDLSHKGVGFTCSDGTIALTYAGLGRLGSTDIADWIRESLRGKPLTVDQTVAAIMHQANLDIAPHLTALKMQHAFIIAAFVAGRPCLGELRNFGPDGGILPEFVLAATPVPAGMGGFAAWPNLLTESERDKLFSLSSLRPRKPEQFSKLLARANKRVAARDNTVSEHCVVRYLPADGKEGGVTTRFYIPEGTTSAQASTPFIFWGIDMTDSMRHLMDALDRQPTDGTLGPPETPDEHKAAERAARGGISPRNSLARYRRRPPVTKA